MSKLTKQEEQLLKLKRQLFLNNLRDRLNQIPEDISCIYQIKKDGHEKEIICAREENGWILISRIGSYYHRNAAGIQGEEAKYNKKFIRPDEFGGSSEAVICFPPDKEPYLVTDPVNGGTYNFISPVRGKRRLVSFRLLLGHFHKDVLPYLKQDKVNKKLQEISEHTEKNGSFSEEQK